MSHETSAAQHLQVALATGHLALDIYAGSDSVDALLGFASRANRKRGFLFVSKVLGKHWPATPAAMRRVHGALAAQVAAAELPQPLVFIAMAETAIGLGQGVFEAFMTQQPQAQALFLHSTRYHLGASPLLEFAEEHSHAPQQYLHLPSAPAQQALMLGARTLVLVDDEASTGKTFVNLAQACGAINPALSHIHLATIANFVGRSQAADLAQRFGLPVTSSALLQGEFRFAANDFAVDAPPAQGVVAEHESGASGLFGRLGLLRPLRLCSQRVAAISASIPLGESVLVLGTGEFMHMAFLLGAALEAQGHEPRVQSSTRSPILTGGAISCGMQFADNYGEGIANYLYNVTPGQYQHVLICHETPPNAALYEFARILGGRLLHFLAEDHIEEIPVCGS